MSLCSISPWLVTVFCADSTPEDASFLYITRGPPGSVDQEGDRFFVCMPDIQV